MMRTSTDASVHSAAKMDAAPSTGPPKSDVSARTMPVGHTQARSRSVIQKRDANRHDKAVTAAS